MFLLPYNQTLMGKREPVALLNLSFWCLEMVEWLFLVVQWGCLRFVIVVFPDHTHLLFLNINQLVDIYNSFCKAVDEGEEVRAVFCDISKAFGQVWHKGLLNKLQTVGITGPLHQWFTDYLNNRKQMVALPGAFLKDWCAPRFNTWSLALPHLHK